VKEEKKQDTIVGKNSAMKKDKEPYNTQQIKLIYTTY
jgi:hypothetical protein